MREFFWPTKTTDDLIVNSPTEINATRWKPYTPEVWNQLFVEFRPEFKKHAGQITLLVERIAQQLDTLTADAVEAEKLQTWKRLAKIAGEMAEGFAEILDDAAIDFEVETFLNE